MIDRSRQERAMYLDTVDQLAKTAFDPGCVKTQAPELPRSIPPERAAPSGVAAKPNQKAALLR